MFGRGLGIQRKQRSSMMTCGTTNNGFYQSYIVHENKLLNGGWSESNRSDLVPIGILVQRQEQINCGGDVHVRRLVQTISEQRATRRKPTLLCLIAILLRGGAVNLIQICSILEFCKKHPNVAEQSTGPSDHQDRVRGRNKSWTTVNQHELETCRKYYFTQNSVLSSPLPNQRDISSTTNRHSFQPNVSRWLAKNYRVLNTSLYKGWNDHPHDTHIVRNGYYARL